MNEALLLGERICIMDAGKIIQVDTPEAIQNIRKIILSVNFQTIFARTSELLWR